MPRADVASGPEGSVARLAFPAKVLLAWALVGGVGRLLTAAVGLSFEATFPGFRPTGQLPRLADAGFRGNTCATIRARL